MATTHSLFILTAAFSLLSLNCTPPPQNFIPAHPTVSSLIMNRTHVTGLVQCRFGLDPARCKQCAQFAKRTVLKLCPNSEAVTAWFDGCYFEASVEGFAIGRSTLTRSCSGPIPVQWAGFEPALSVFLMRFRSAAQVGDQFSYRENLRISILITSIHPIPNTYGGLTIEGHVECIRTLAIPECRSCIEQAVEELQQSCLDSSKGYVVVDRCLAEFEALGIPSSSSVADSARQGGNGKRVRRLVVVCWVVVMVCLAGFVLCVWFVQRSIVNGAQVAALDLTTTLEDGDK